MSDEAENCSNRARVQLNAGGQLFKQMSDNSDTGDYRNGGVRWELGATAHAADLKGGGEDWHTGGERACAIMIPAAFAL